MPCQCDKSSDHNIFESKKLQEIKNGYAAATKVLCLYLYFLPLLAAIAHYLVT